MIAVCLPAVVLVSLMSELRSAAAGETRWVNARVECGGADGAQVPCREAGNRYVLVAGGERLRISPADPNGRVFDDVRVRNRNLWVRLWRQADGTYSVLRVLAEEEGKFWELYYFCRTCNIRAFAGGPCWCCQAEFEFRREPIDPATIPDFPRR
ncbi:MAG: hypothetical protein Kow00109_27410 [Acidobacteriota bacterium]